jgi:hypothetical protein
MALMFALFCAAIVWGLWMEWRGFVTKNKKKD